MKGIEEKDDEEREKGCMLYLPSVSSQNWRNNPFQSGILRRALKSNYNYHKVLVFAVLSVAIQWLTGSYCCSVYRVSSHKLIVVASWSLPLLNYPQSLLCHFYQDHH